MLTNKKFKGKTERSGGKQFRRLGATVSKGQSATPCGGCSLSCELSTTSERFYDEKKMNTLTVHLKPRCCIRSRMHCANRNVQGSLVSPESQSELTAALLHEAKLPSGFVNDSCCVRF